MTLTSAFVLFPSSFRGLCGFKMVEKTHLKHPRSCVQLAAVFPEIVLHLFAEYNSFHQRPVRSLDHIRFDLSESPGSKLESGEAISLQRNTDEACSSTIMMTC